MEPDVSVSRTELAEIKSEIRGLREELKGEIGEFRDELKGEIGELREELKGEVGELRGDMVRGFGRVDGRIDTLQSTLIMVGGGMIVGLVGVIAAVLARGV